MKNSPFLIILLTLLCLCWDTAQAREHEWTNTRGQTIKAEFIFMKEDNVTISMKGKTYGLKLSSIGSDGTVYVGSEDKKLYALSGKSGVKLWEFETGESEHGVHSSPAIGSDGTVYVGSWNNKLYALATSSKGLAKSPWPMRGQNAQHTGRVTNKATEPTETKDFPKEIEGNTLTLQEDDPEVVFKRKVSTKHPAELAHVWVPGPFAGTDQVLILSKEGKLTINPRKGLTIKGTWGVPQGVAGNQVILTFDHPETGREHVLKYEYMLGEQEIQDLSGKTTGKEVVLYLKGIGNNKDETEYVRPVK